jgi:hypothetical protein
VSVVNPLAHLTDDELVAAHSQQGVNTHFLSEMLRRHKNASVELGDKMWWLNVWLLLATIAILVLTVVLVWTTFRGIGDERRRATVTSPPSGAAVGSASWVLWQLSPVDPRNKNSELAWEIVRAFDGPSAQSVCSNFVATSAASLPLRRHLCLPDTIDPRGPKGK